MNYEDRVKEVSLKIAETKWNNEQIGREHPLHFDNLSPTTQGFLSAKEIEVAKLSISREAEAYEKGWFDGKNYEAQYYRLGVSGKTSKEHLKQLGLVP